MENNFVVIGKKGSEIKLKDEVLRLSDSDHKQDGFMSPCDEKDIKFYHESYPDGIFYVKSQLEIVYPSDEEIEKRWKNSDNSGIREYSSKWMREEIKSLNQNRTSVQTLASSDKDNWVKVEDAEKQSFEAFLVCYKVMRKTSAPFDEAALEYATKLYNDYKKSAPKE